MILGMWNLVGGSGSEVGGAVVLKEVFDSYRKTLACLWSTLHAEEKYTYMNTYIERLNPFNSIQFNSIKSKREH